MARIRRTTGHSIEPSDVQGLVRHTSAWSRLEAFLGGAPVLHRVRNGSGVPLLLVHGIGPGTTGEVNFGRLIELMPHDWPLHLIDLAGFGESFAAAARPGFDPPRWLDQIDQALDRIRTPTLLVGNSVGGALALKTAARRRDLHGVVAIGAPAAHMETTEALAAFWRTPRDREALVAAMRPMTAARERPSPELVEPRWRAFADEAYAGWYGEALADPQSNLLKMVLSPEEARRISAPLTLIHGLQDRACPPAPLARLVMEHLPQADLELLGKCGHNVLAERTRDVIATLAQIRNKEQPS
jgi:pimeloyl-ACP methyl ester carboxylesterase